MSFSSITNAQIASGKATAQEIFQKTKDNFDDHEDRILNLEVGGKVLAPIDFNVLGLLNPPFSYTGLLYYRVASSVRVLSARLLVITAGSAGTLEIDIQYKRGVAAWASILSSAISSAYTAGNLALQTGVLSFQDLDSGDLLRLNVNSVQTAMKDFSVYLEIEARNA